MPEKSKEFPIGRAIHFARPFFARYHILLMVLYVDRDMYTETGCHFTPRTPRAGFTLVEAVFVCAIISIIGAMTVPRYASYLASQQTDAAARRVLSDLMYAQRQARVTSTSQHVVFDLIRGSYQLSDINDPNRKNQLYSVDLSKDPYRATIVTATFGGDSTVIFDGYGAPDTAGTVTVKVGRYSQTIRLDAGFSRPRISGSVSVDAM